MLENFTLSRSYSVYHVPMLKVTDAKKNDDDGSDDNISLSKALF